jgi:hypothetical protein
MVAHTTCTRARIWGYPHTWSAEVSRDPGHHMLHPHATAGAAAASAPVHPATPSPALVPSAYPSAPTSRAGCTRLPHPRAAARPATEGGGGGGRVVVTPNSVAVSAHHVTHAAQKHVFKPGKTQPLNVCCMSLVTQQGSLLPSTPPSPSPPPHLQLWRGRQCWHCCPAAAPAAPGAAGPAPPPPSRRHVPPP